MTRGEIIELFMEQADKAGAETFRVDSVDGLNQALSTILEGHTSIYCPRVTDKEKSVVVPEARQVEDYFVAGVCVEEVAGAIAETGTIICSSDGGKPVQAGLLPAHHVAIVSTENIVETLEDAFALWKDAPPANITLETGPSRTADIELTVTIGVHGPERLSIIVF